MRARSILLSLVLALPGLRCAEATFVDDDVPVESDGATKDDVMVEDLGDDAKVPPADLGGDPDAAVESDAPAPDDVGADVVTELDLPPTEDAMDASTTDAVVVDAGPIDAVALDSGPRDTGVVDSGPRDTGVVDTGPRDTGVVDTGPVDTGVVDTGPAYPPILCPLLGTPIPISCRSRNGLRPCCGIGGACFCEQSSPFGPLCLPCS